MSKRLVDVEKANLLLFNMLFRQQVYLEGLKVGMNVYFRRMLTALYSEFAKYLMQTRYDNLDAFTTAELQQFIYRFQTAQSKLYNSYTQQLIGLLKQFVKAEVEVTNAIYSKVNDHPTSTPKQPEKHKALQLQDQPSSADPDVIWTKALDEIIPANGLTLKEMLMNFGATSLAKVAQQVKIGYANNQSVQEMMREIAGTQGNSNDGLFAVFANQNATILATALQHLSSIAQESIASEFYAQYQWVSILDSRTTLICRSRNGNIYNYGEGPLPPAHWNCRSKAVSLAQGDALHDIPDTFFDWATTQPDEFLRDALGVTIASKIITDDISAKDISISGAAKSLTISQFKSKIDLITL